MSRPVKSRFRLHFRIDRDRRQLLIAMALDTKVVKIGSAAAIQPGVFSPAAFGASEFPKVQAEIEKRAVDAATLAEVLAQDKEAAGKLCGVRDQQRLRVLRPSSLALQASRISKASIRSQSRAPRNRWSSTSRLALQSTGPTCATRPARSHLINSSTRSITRTPAPP